MANLTDADKVLRNDTGKDIVTKLNAIKTAIENSGGGSSTFEGLSDVDINDQTLTNGQVPKYNSSTQKWENGDVSLVGNLDDLSDVDTTGKAVGDSLRYDGAEWIAQPTTVALTQAEYDALQLSGDLVPNTHYVITDATNLNPTASDIEYSGAVTVKQAIDSKQDTINGSYTTSGLTPHTNATITEGGYCKIGNLCIVNMRISLSASTSGTLISGLPTPKGSQNMVSCANNKNADMSIIVTGELSVTTALSGTVFANAVYLCN